MTTNRKYSYLLWILLPLWFAISVTASALQVFRADSRFSVHPPLPIGLAVGLPILLFATWFAVSDGFRQFVLSVNAQTLTTIQAWRLGGFTFLVLYNYGILPGIFALPAGVGDIAIGATAPFVARFLTQDSGRKNSFIIWQLLGVADLVNAVTIGVLASPTPLGILAGRISTDAITTLPLSLIPTFIVPLLLIFHFISIAQARRWAGVSDKHIGQLRTAVS